MPRLSPLPFLPAKEVQELLPSNWKKGEGAGKCLLAVGGREGDPNQALYSCLSTFPWPIFHLPHQCHGSIPGSYTMDTPAVPALRAAETEIPAGISGLPGIRDTGEDLC